MIPEVIEKAVANYLRSKLGKPHILTITFDGDFVSGNTVSGTVQVDGKDYNGGAVPGTPEAFESVSFATDQATTMRALARAIQALDSVLSVQIVAGSSNRAILVTGKNVAETLGLDLAVAGGVSQPDFTVTDTQESLWVKVQTENSNQIGDDYDNTLKPAYPYATFKINSVVPLSVSGRHDFDEETDLPLHVQSFEATIGVNYFGNDAFYELQKAQSRLFTAQASNHFSVLGFAVRNRSSVRDLSALLENAFEPRAQFEFFLGFQDSWFEDYGTINSVHIKGTMNTNGSEEIFMDDTIEGE